MMRILLLAGTGEAVSLAKTLTAAGHDVTSSLAGATRSPKQVAGHMRVGGFGGDAGFAAWLGDHQPDAVIDATHPFASGVSRRSAQICGATGIPYVQLLRPAWPVHADKRQYQVADAAQARALVPADQTVFLATGRQTLQEFSAFADCRLICRQIDPPDAPFPFANGAFLVGRPPFSVADERALFKRLGVTWLIAKNAGGAASYSKIEAAAALRIPVIFLARPKQPDADQRATIDEIITWVAQLDAD